MTRDMLRTMAQENLVFISSHMLAEPVTCFGEPSRTAEVTQQVVRTYPVGVDVEEIGRLEMFSGDGDLNGRVNSMPWSRWSLTVRRYFGELNQTATRLLQRVETDVEDPIITDHTTMTGAERRLSEQLYCVLALTCWKRAPQVVQQVPRGYGFEAWRHLCRKFCTASSGEVLWNAPSPLVVDEISRAKAVGPLVEKQKKGPRGTVGRRGV